MLADERRRWCDRAGLSLKDDDEAPEEARLAVGAAWTSEPSGLGLRSERNGRKISSADRVQILPVRLRKAGRRKKKRVD